MNRLVPELDLNYCLAVLKTEICQLLEFVCGRPEAANSNAMTESLHLWIHPTIGHDYAHGVRCPLALVYRSRVS